ncbi:MAG: Crp/Fnr family transcriptional regulator [Armatimonadetes bacterium]|nr:Crp/Fnr family transcriptional regulator [Armatimonadota bacterium]
MIASRATIPQPSCSDCETCKLPSQDLFSGMSFEDFAQLGLLRRCRAYRKKDIVFREGDPAQRLYCVIRGWIKIWKMTPEGHLQIVRWAGPGDPLGYRSMAAGEAYRATAQAATRAVVCLLERPDLRRLLASHPILARNVLTRLTQDLGTAEERLLQITHRPVRQRLAQLLIQLDSQQAEGFRISRMDMAHIIGTSPETLVRLLTELHEDGVLRRTRKGLELLNRSELERLAGMEPDPGGLPRSRTNGKALAAGH